MNEAEKGRLLQALDPEALWWLFVDMTSALDQIERVTLENPLRIKRGGLPSDELHTILETRNKAEELYRSIVSLVDNFSVEVNNG